MRYTDDYKLQMAIYRVLLFGEDVLIVTKGEKEMACKENAENTCRSYPKCEGCNAHTMRSKNLTKVIEHPYTKTEKAVYERDDEKWGAHIITRCAGGGPEYLAGPIVNRLHEFEKLGFEPNELRRLIEEHRKKKAWQLAVNSLYGIMGRSNGKTLMMSEMMKRYIDTDIAITRKMCEGVWEKVNPYLPKKFPEIKNVIFNKPATIVFWSDGDKTVVKAQDGEPYDPEKGIAMAIAKKALGNNRNYWPKIAKHLKTAKKQGVQSEVVHLDYLLTEFEEKKHCRYCSEKAYDYLTKALNDKKATKAQMVEAIEDAVRHLGEILAE